MLERPPALADKPSLFLLPLVTLGLIWATACQAFSPPTPTPLPSSLPTSQAFLTAWQEGDYSAMYSYLSSTSQSQIREEEFTSRYQQALSTMTLNSLTLELGQEEIEGDHRLVDFAVNFDTILLGQYQVTNTLPLIWEDGWWVDWSPGLIYPGLSSEDRLHLQRLRPSRAGIYTRDGQPLAIDGLLVTVGVVPGEIQDEAELVRELSRILEMPEEEIQDKYHRPEVQPDWLVPIGDISFEESLEEMPLLQSIPGVQLVEKPIRTYPQGTTAAHIVGYLGEISSEELADYQDKGYREGDLIGKGGLEKWGEEYLAGHAGGVLSILDPQGEVVEILRENPAQPSQSIYTTIDLRVQRAAEEALGERRGAVAAIDPRTGEVLAMASNPGFDPNDLVAGIDIQSLLTDPESPLLNRATQAALPTGSAFKIITTAAALEGSDFDPSFTIQDPGYWDAPWGRRYLDWRAHGMVDFRQAIIQSCDTFFYRIGLALDQEGQWLLPTFARDFGLGEVTGILGLPPEEEEPGLVPDPDWKECCFTGEGNPFWVPADAVNLAVGQGDLKVTPLQAANFIAAVANGGTLYRPTLILDIGQPPGSGSNHFPPEVLGELPISQEHLQFMQAALHGVTVPPLGTARAALAGLDFSAAGKTGTAESGGELPHAWFVGYAPADDPQIAVAAMLENIGTGAEFAVPIFRTVAEAYLLPPKETTPTPTSLATPAPDATPSPISLTPTPESP